MNLINQIQIIKFNLIVPPQNLERQKSFAKIISPFRLRDDGTLRCHQAE